MKDLFSVTAKQYATFRPTYPKELYDFIYNHVAHFDTAWDCGTGNGQVARDLSIRFKNVYATDISTKQIENAYAAENISYSVAAEEIDRPANSIDLITVAQAIHWFDREKFYNEVGRVAKKSALLAVWGYGLLGINEDIDGLLKDFYTNTVGPYWDKERKLIDHEYRTISFPFKEIPVPGFTFSFLWTQEELRGYLSTWSSVQKFYKQHGSNPVERLMERLHPHWSQERMTITFPLFLRLGKVQSAPLN
jgi:hypothetical protein